MPVALARGFEPHNLFDLLFGLAGNLTILFGVCSWGWSPGNVWIAFLIESISVSLITALRLWRLGPQNGLMDYRFWMILSGGFVLVLGVFTILMAVAIGVTADLTLALPIGLVLLRGGAEAVSVLLGAPQRGTLIVVRPMLRMWVLMVGLWLGFVLNQFLLGRLTIFRSVGGWALSAAAAPVAALIGVKIWIEVWLWVKLVRKGENYFTIDYIGWGSSPDS
jgi:hypothetical protein